MKIQAKIAIMLVLALLLPLSACSKNNISGRAVEKFRIYSVNDGLVEINIDDMTECARFTKDNAEKVCAVIKGYSCDYCNEYMNKP